MLYINFVWSCHEHCHALIFKVEIKNIIHNLGKKSDQQIIFWQHFRLRINIRWNSIACLILSKIHDSLHTTVRQITFWDHLWPYRHTQFKLRFKHVNAWLAWHAYYLVYFKFLCKHISSLLQSFRQTSMVTHAAQSKYLTETIQQDVSKFTNTNSLMCMLSINGFG